MTQTNPLETSGGTLSDMDVAVQWRDDPRQLSDLDEDDDLPQQPLNEGLV